MSEKQLSNSYIKYVIENGLDYSLLDPNKPSTQKLKQLESIKKKSSSEKTKEEKVLTSRSLKVKNSKWNNVEYEDLVDSSTPVIDKDYQTKQTTCSDLQFEIKLHDILINSPYDYIFFKINNKNKAKIVRVSLNKYTFNEILLYLYNKLEKEYKFYEIFLFFCEYCTISTLIGLKKLSNYLYLNIQESIEEFHHHNKR